MRQVFDPLDTVLRCRCFSCWAASSLVYDQMKECRHDYWKKTTIRSPEVDGCLERERSENIISFWHRMSGNQEDLKWRRSTFKMCWVDSNAIFLSFDSLDRSSTPTSSPQTSSESQASESSSKSSAPSSSPLPKVPWMDEEDSNVPFNDWRHHDRH